MSSATPAPPVGRYGPPPTKTRRRGAAIAAGVAATAGLTLVVWLGLGSAATPVSWKDVGFHVVGPERIDVTFEVTMRPGTSAVCTIDALAPDFSQVGTRSIAVGPTDTDTHTDTVRYTVDIATSQRATTGVVTGCEAR